MTNPLTAEVRAALAKSTPGPWEARPYDCDGTVSWYVYPPGSVHPIGDLPDTSAEEADARLIALLRNNAIALCDALDARDEEPCLSPDNAKRINEDLDTIGIPHGPDDQRLPLWHRIDIHMERARAAEVERDELRRVLSMVASVLRLLGVAGV